MFDLTFEDYTTITCNVKAFLADGQGKFPLESFEGQVIMSNFKNWLTYLFDRTEFKKGEPQGWINYIKSTTDISSQYANILVGTLPGNRYEFYMDSNFDNIKKNVHTELDKIDEALGLFNIKSNPSLVQALEIYGYAVLFIGLIFDILLIIFVVVAILLIYSLLLISVESKTHEIGVMRVLGLTKCGFVGLIVT